MRITSLIAAALLCLFIGGTAEKARACLFISINVAPPPLVVYAQPPIPGPGFMWTPGYWGWDEEVGDYYWVPGAWVPAPEPGLLWTPGYWGWSNGVYVWNAGYWGPHVGFYGGVNYGFGYGGAGFVGGRWEGGAFSYNRAVMNVGVGVGISVNVYSQTVINNNTSRVCFNGGNGGVRAQPSAQELSYANDRRIGASPEQLKHQQLASKNPDLKLANNHGKPAIAATRQAGDFSKGSVYGAKSAGSAVKPASLKTQGTPGGANRNVVKGTGNSGQASNHGTLGNNRTTGSNAGATHTDTKKNANPPKGAALNGQRRPPQPPVRPAPHPVNKQPPKNVKKPT